MKRILSICMVIGLCLGLVGCGNSDKKQEETEKCQSEIRNYDWYQAYTDTLQNIGIVPVNVRIAECGETTANVKVETEKDKNDIDISLMKNTDINNGNWFVHSVATYTPEKKYFYLKEEYRNNTQIYDYATDEVLNKKTETPKEETISNKEKRDLAFKSNGYSDYNGNWRKDVDDEGMYMLFVLGTTEKDSFFDIADGTGENSVMYFYGAGYGGQNHCSYSYELDAPMDGATCNEEEISNAKAVKNIFDNELKTLGLTIDDLN